MATLTEVLVVDASTIVDLLVLQPPAIRGRLEGRALHAPAHMYAEVVSALGRMHRAGVIDDRFVEGALQRLATMPITGHDLPPLIQHAWRRRHGTRVVDALYVELADRLATRVITTDLRLARSSALAEAVSPNLEG